MNNGHYAQGTEDAVKKRLTNEHAKLLVALSTTISIVADLTVSKLSRKVSSLYLV